MAAGDIDLQVETDDGTVSNGAGRIAIDFSADDRSGNERITLSVPESSNPAYLWTVSTCLDDPDLAAALEVSLAYVDCADGTLGPLVASGSSFDGFHQDLQDSPELDGDRSAPGRSCLQNGSSLCLQLSWELDEQFQGPVDGSFSLQFRAQQCRHSTGNSDPFPDIAATCAETATTGKAISWVAFCAKEGATITDQDLSFSVDDDTLILEDCPDAVKTVLLKYGTELRVFEDPNPETTFRTNDGGETHRQQGQKFPSTTADRSNPTPCPGTCGVVYEIENGSARQQSNKGCSS